jgi:hypothetical protein
MHGTVDHHIKQSKSDSERQILHVFFNMRKRPEKKEHKRKRETIGGGIGRKKHGEKRI